MNILAATGVVSAFLLGLLLLAFMVMLEPLSLVWYALEVAFLDRQLRD
ncbi:MAG: hypothetical protein HYR64_06595 [Fimbriimonas ginsengisoli]|uniref:Uncharacterized protein n=1 Tax=Fimbriimonas ginsengisoli TaxID=1005039 RepID=A0A931LV47_FIMGI|nr:hypothetical protein [Fimbriimonas ginsengisoli]